MASEIVDGLRIPLPVAGRAALDFLNTRAGWPEQTNEYLHTYPHLAVWCRERGLVDERTCRLAMAAARRRPGSAEELRLRAKTLREALRAVLVSGQGTPATARAGWPVVRAEVEAAQALLELGPGGDAGGAAGSVGAVGAWRLSDAVDAERVPFAQLVLDVGRVLVEPASRSVRACPMPDCGWVFADPTGRRRWCSMAWCGNRSKVRRHAARTRALTPTPARPTGR